MVREAKDKNDVAVAEKRCLLTINSTSESDGTDAVFLSVNGRAYQIPRDKEVNVPESVVSVLQDAVVRSPILNDAGNVVAWKDAKRFSFSYKEAGAKEAE